MSEPDRNTVLPPRILLMGVGSGGVRLAAALQKRYPDLNAVAIDTDTQVLKSVAIDEIIPLGGTITKGFSAGGDVEIGRQCIEKESGAIRSRLRQVDLLIIVSGLGGGTGSGVVPVLTRLAREAGTLSMCMLSMPFMLEGKPCMKKAEEALKKVRTHADAIIRIPNERLIDRKESGLTLEEAFDRGQRVMIEGVGALWHLLSGSGICRLDYAGIQTMLRNCDGFCHFAYAEANTAARAADLTEAILHHPLLNNGKVLAKAVGIIVGIIGGPDLKLTEVDEIMEKIQDTLPEEVWLNLGMMIDDGYAKRLAAVVLVAEQWKEPLMDDARRQLGFTFSRRSVEQGELPLETIGKGRFSNVDSTIHDGQDLDVPTYIRREIRLPR